MPRSGSTAPTGSCGWPRWSFEDGSRVHSYKHVTTRRYLHLPGDGRAFAYLGDHRYREIDLEIAVDLVFVGWERDEDEDE